MSIQEYAFAFLSAQVIASPLVFLLCQASDRFCFARTWVHWCTYIAITLAIFFGIVVFAHGV